MVPWTARSVRLARVGWIVVILDVDERIPAMASLSSGWGTLHSEQTVPFAEVAAF